MDIVVPAGASDLRTDRLPQNLAPPGRPDGAPNQRLEVTHTLTWAGHWLVIAAADGTVAVRNFEDGSGPKTTILADAITARVGLPGRLSVPHLVHMRESMGWARRTEWFCPIRARPGRCPQTEVSWERCFLPAPP